MSHVPMTRPKEALAIHETPYYHSSTFVQLDGGRILQCVWGGALIHSDDGGLTWSKPGGQDHTDDAGNHFHCQFRDTNGNPVVGGECSLVKLSGKNSIGLAARVHENPSSSEYAMLRPSMSFKFWRSDDNGATWQPPVRMSPPGLNTASYQDVFLRSSSGRILLPVYACLGSGYGPDNKTLPMSGKLFNNQWVSSAGHFFDPRFATVYILYSDDDGRTWQRNQDGEIMILLDWSTQFSYCGEPSMTEVAPGRLLVVMRNGLGRLFQAWSNDNGDSWTRPQPTVLAACTTPAQIRTLPNGHLLCIWNQESEAEVRRGDNRTRVSSAVSRDGGRVWEFFQNLYSVHETTRVEPGPIHPVRPEEIYFNAGLPAVERDPVYVRDSNAKYRGSYPSCFVMEDRVLVTHTCGEYEEHATKAQILFGKRVAPDKPNQMLKVLPLKWFYGGKQPADNPYLREAYEPAKP